MNIGTSPNSPDFSPASVSSALLTPTDLSPTGRSFDVKLHSPYEHAHSGHPYLSQPSLIFENGSPVKNQNIPPSNLAAPRQPLVHLHHARHQGPSNPGTFFEPFAEPPTPAPASPQNQNIYSPPLSSDLSQSIYTSPPPPARRMDPARLPPMDWRPTQQGPQHLFHQTQAQVQQGQQVSGSAEWRLVGEKPAGDFAFNVGQEDTLRSSFSYQQPSTSQSFQGSHEVSLLSNDYKCRYMLIYARPTVSPLTFFLCFIRPLPLHTISSLLESSNRQINKHLFFFSKSSRLPTWTRGRK